MCAETLAPKRHCPVVHGNFIVLACLSLIVGNACPSRLTCADIVCKMSRPCLCRKHSHISSQVSALQIRADGHVCNPHATHASVLALATFFGTVGVCESKVVGVRTCQNDNTPWCRCWRTAEGCEEGEGGGHAHHHAGWHASNSCQQASLDRNLHLPPQPGMPQQTWCCTADIVASIFGYSVDFCGLCSP